MNSDYKDIAIIGEIPASRANEKILVRIIEFKEDAYLDMRCFFITKDGDRPSNKGFRIPLSEIKNFTEMVDNVASAVAILEN